MITVFYGRQVYGEFTKLPRLAIVGSEVYNGALAYDGKEWWNMDGTPVLLANAPKELRMLALILNL